MKKFFVLSIALSFMVSVAPQPSEAFIPWIAKSIFGKKDKDSDSRDDRSRDSSSDSRSNDGYNPHHGDPDGKRSRYHDY